MKVLFVDDEPLIRKGLQAILSWKEYGFTRILEAEDGESALEIIRRENPQLVLMDIQMQKLSGLDVSGAVREAGFTGRIIIITGYSDFEYAKRAISSEATAYLLKPVDPEELEAAVNKALDELERENLLSIYAGQTVKQVKEKILSELLEGQISYTKEMERTCSLGLDSGFLCLSAVYMKGTETNLEKLLEFAAQVSDGANMVILDRAVYLLHTDSKLCQDFWQKVEEKSEDYRKEDVFLILGCPFFDVGKLNAAYQRIVHVMEHIFYYAEESHVIKLESREEKKKEPFDMIEGTGEAMDAVFQGDKGLLDLFLKKFADSLFQRKSAVDAFGFILGNFWQQIQEKLCGHYPNLRYELPDYTSFMNRIGGFNYFYQCMEYLRQQMYHAMELVSEYHRKHPVEGLCCYIEEHYVEPLKLETLAAKFGYNPIYLGKLLRAEKGVSYNTYVDGVRLEHAKKLLLSDVSVARTAESIGYKDIDYFTKKFKKYTGVLPSEYKRDGKKETR